MKSVGSKFRVSLALDPPFCKVGLGRLKYGYTYKLIKEIVPVATA